ncbi:glycoside hydrolase family 88 protein [Nocardioides sp. YIM 152315]|uniref:glycoside hydrolase family 88 protein n=1 Tax=Nocardioides sp. YIM 152315 TaxID=3031760 RepID=UPI0023DB2A3D|nr:glycoside hydrolase family 88 protein [Nocardioides sp. YIM 152315]MDF1602216.1 glycoside hydrolase family 88 protein [Nocardioides sp. YIM 152315]
MSSKSATTLSMPPRLPADLVRRVAENLMSHDIGDDYWERQAAMAPILAFGEPLWREQVISWLDRAIATQTTDGRLCSGATSQLRYGDFPISRAPLMAGFVLGPCGAAYFTAPLFLAYARTGDPKYRRAALRQIAAFLDGPRTSEGFMLMNAAASEVWVDTVYPVCGALAVWGTAEGNQAWVDEAYRHLEIAYRRLLDPATGLVRHVWREMPNSFPESNFWSRGIGFLACASAEVLAVAGTHSEAIATRDRLGNLLEAVSGYQDRSGMLHDVLDDPTSPPESTGTVMFAYAAALAAAHDVVGDDLVVAASKAIVGVSRCVTASGTVRRAMLPPGGPGVPLGEMVLGQSFFLAACHHLDAIRELRGT